MIDHVTLRLLLIRITLTPIVLASLGLPASADTSTAVSVSTGNGFTCALTAGGGVKCWGSNSNGRLGDGTTTNRLTAVDVTGLTSGVAAISAGSSHACALTTSGGVKCWGRGDVGQLGDGVGTDRLTAVDVLELPPGPGGLVAISGVVAISAGAAHTCALTASGAVKCWGFDTQWLSYIAYDVPGLTSGVAKISAGSYYTCALTTAGGVKCWGSNAGGQLGDGTTSYSWVPVDVTGLASGVAAISAGGGGHSCAVTTGGATKCWGDNSYGQLGDGTTTQRLTAVDVTGLTSGVVAISGGGGQTCALTTSGSVKCWGWNSAGQLGDGTFTNRPTPVDVTGVTSGSAGIAAGADHTCALTTAGGVKCWGSNQTGALGDGTPVQRLTAVDATGLTSGVAAASAGGVHTCALTTGGGVKCWGDNAYGQLGDGTWIDSPTAVDATGLISGVAAITGRLRHACALTTAGLVKCWGWNSVGQLGDGTTVDRPTSVDVTGLTTGVAEISAGNGHTCALTNAGGVKCWGYNAYGQLGDGTATDSSTAVDVVGLASGVTAISAGGVHTCALTSAGGVKCLGGNTAGQLGDGTTTDSSTAVDVASLTSGVASISAGAVHTCALTTAGGVKCWGWNLYGQLGDGTTTNRETPVDVTGLTSGVAAIFAGSQHTCAMTTGGDLKCWGDNAFGQLGDGTTVDRETPVDVTALTSGVEAVSLGQNHTCAVTTAGSVKCWGWNLDGQLGNGESGFALSPTSAAGFAAACGNGTTEFGEQCDDGNQTTGDCCSATCQFETGTQAGCTDSDLCTADACNGAGACIHTPMPDSDGDTVCDAQDACTNAGGARDFYAKSKLILSKINTDPTPGNDGLKVSATFDLPLASSFSALNPTARGARILLLNQAGGIEVDQVLPGGAYAGSGSRGWKSNTKGTVWQYLDKTVSPLSGITTLKLTDKSKMSPGRVSASLTGKKATYPVVTADSPLQMVVVLGNQTDAIAGYCAESQFSSTGCVFNGSQTTIICKK